jgi:hypothetical protein
MISTSDRKFLEASAAPLSWRRIAIWCLPLVWVAMALGDLYVAAKLGETVGLSLKDAVSLWYYGTAGAGLSALAVRALIRIQSAFGDIVIAIAFIGFPFIAEIRRRRDNRMAKVLKDAGAW